MASETLRLADKGLIEVPEWMHDGLQLEVMIGSISYGCNRTDDSDIDLGGFAIPPANHIFQHLDGKIPGFGSHPKPFEQVQKQHVEDKEKRKTYDLTIYGIVKFFQLCRNNNPNMVDMLFVPKRCVKFSTPIAEMVRERRQLFLHKGSWEKFRNYARDQMKKIDLQKNRSNPKRQESIQKYGYDTKFAYHLVRLLLECEQILTHHDLVIDRDREIYKSIRRGEWTLAEVKDWFAKKSTGIEILYTNSTLREVPDDDKLQDLLHNCLEEYYGSMGASERETRNTRKYHNLMEGMEKLLSENRARG